MRCSRLLEDNNSSPHSYLSLELVDVEVTEVCDLEALNHFEKINHVNLFLTK